MKAIEIEKLRKIYQPHPLTRDPAVEALRGVSLEVESGTLYTLLGPNGAGKTTLLHILSGLIPPTEGEVRVAGIPVRNQKAVAQKIGLLNTGAEGFLEFMTGRENLEFFSVLQNMGRGLARKRIRELVGVFELEPYLERKVKTYSSGIRQRFLIARALLHDPEIILLDEPIAHLDPLATRDFHTLLRDQLVRGLGKTVLLTTHQLEEAQEISDRLAFLYQGELMWEKPAEVFRSREENLLNEYLVARANGKLASR